MKWEIDSARAFAAHAGRWDALQREAAAMPFLESTFLQPLLDEYVSDREVVAFCEDGGRTCAAAIMTRQTRGVWQTWQPSQLPLGPWIAHAGSDIAALLKSLIPRLPGWALVAGLSQLDPALQARPAATATLDTLDYVNTAWVDISGDFETYWQARGKNLRQNVRKQRSKLQADGVTVTLDCVTSASDVASCIGDYGRLESSGWKAGRGTAVHSGNDQGRFYTAMLENFCAQGRGRIYRLCIDERPIAMDLCIEQGPVLVILKTTYDESLKALSPASLMHHDVFGHLFGEGKIARVEFYGKLMEWHTRWTDRSRMLYHATCYRSRWLPAIRKSIAGLRSRESSPLGAASETPE